MKKLGCFGDSLTPVEIIPCLNWVLSKTISHLLGFCLQAIRITLAIFQGWKGLLYFWAYLQFELTTLCLPDMHFKSWSHFQAPLFKLLITMLYVHILCHLIILRLLLLKHDSHFIRMSEWLSNGLKKINLIIIVDWGLHLWLVNYNAIVSRIFCCAFLILH